MSFAQDANQLLREVSTKVNSYNNIVLSFKYSLQNPSENVSQETRGDVSLKGDKYLLNLMGAKQLYDGKKLHVIIPEDEEINISTPEGSNGLNPATMFSFYEKGYHCKMDIVQNRNGRKIQFVKLVPKDSNNEFSSVMLGIDQQTKHIYKMILNQKNKTTITITVNSFKINQPISETLFTFDESKYLNYYINNLD